MEIETWFKTKKYPHIGRPITIKDYDWVREYVSDFNKVRKHSFLPFIHKSIVKRKFRADKSGGFKNPSGKRRRVLGKPKIRDIYFASHLDSLILSKYNEMLAERYEGFMKRTSFNESIVAYRKISVDNGSLKNKCNIDFAKSAFEFIKNNNTEKLTVIVADITSFFDNLDHKILKKNWARMLDEKSLPRDHYNIFKALTRIRYVEADQLFESYGNTMMVKTGVPNVSNKTRLVRKSIKCSKYFKEKKATHYCEKKEFIRHNLNLIISKKNTSGIPQGSPISATLANIYMVEFDQFIFNKVQDVGGFYQRYSDDLIVICSQNHEDEIIKGVREGILNIANLEIEPSKTRVFRFEEVKGQFSGFEIDEVTKIPNFNKSLEYLGFTFDGQRVLVKTSGFSKFYRAMKRSFKKSTSLALYSKNPDRSLFKSRLYKRFTHRGAKRRRLYEQTKQGSHVFIKTNKFYWGNYLSYLKKANNTMKSVNQGDQIKRQSRRLWKNFNDLMRFHEGRLSKEKGSTSRVEG